MNLLQMLAESAGKNRSSINSGRAWTCLRRPAGGAEMLAGSRCEAALHQQPGRLREGTGWAIGEAPNEERQADFSAVRSQRLLSPVAC
jgi:hypothetical protein